MWVCGIEKCLCVCLYDCPNDFNDEDDRRIKIMIMAVIMVTAMIISLPKQPVDNRNDEGDDE